MARKINKIRAFIAYWPLTLQYRRTLTAICFQLFLALLSDYFPVLLISSFRSIVSSSSSGAWALEVDVTGTNYSRSVDQRDFTFYVATSYNDQGERDYSLWAARDGVLNIWWEEKAKNQK